jgi:hypothetical protein
MKKGIQNIIKKFSKMMVHLLDTLQIRRYGKLGFTASVYEHHRCSIVNFTQKLKSLLFYGG